MSNFLAIATVTATLQRYLQSVIGADVPGAKANTVRPDASGQGLPEVGVNIFLYQVTPNAALRNTDLPARNNSGQGSQQPAAALDLHYLMSFYGADAQLEPQRVLGSVVRSLHSRPVFTRQMIRDTVTDPSYAYLATSNLADAIDLVRLSPSSFSLEEFSKLWSVMLQTPYALSVAYCASVVLIEDDTAPVMTPVPVRQRQVFAVPFSPPVIAGLSPQIVTAGATLTINGQNLRGDATQIKLGDTLVPPATMSGRQITVTLPATLPAGIRTVQVVQNLNFGTAADPHPGFESNAMPFVLAPSISIGAVTSATVTIKFVPSVGKMQRVKLLLNELNAPSTRPENDYNLDAPDNNGITTPMQKDTDTIVFVINAPGDPVLAADYLVRVQVDGAESQPDVDTNTNSPTFGQYLGTPKITVP